MHAEVKDFRRYVDYVLLLLDPHYTYMQPSVCYSINKNSMMISYFCYEATSAGMAITVN